MKQFLSQFPSKKILVVGDVVLDLYIHGEVERISPEAPVPVILEKSRHYVLGGAGNVAANAAALSGKVTLVSVIGRDEEAQTTAKLCKESGIAGRFVRDALHPTPLKTRPVARRHQLLRIDRENSEYISKGTERALVGLIRRLPRHDVVVVSDYAKGCLTKAVLDVLKRRFGAHRVIAGVKPKSESLYRSIAVVTLNLGEGYELTGIHAATNALASRAVKKLAAHFRSSVVLTRGEHGMTVYEYEKKKIVHVPSHVLQVFDVTGAGDTVLAAIGLSLASGAPLHVAAEIANRAAGVVVGLEGTATVSRKVLAGTFS